MSYRGVSRFRLGLATFRAATLHVLTLSSVFVVLGTIAVGRIIEYGALEPFRIGQVEIPKLMGSRASNLAVAIFCLVAILAVALGYLLRYLQTRSVLAKLRAKGVTDFDNNGKTDVFTDRFLDDM